MRDAPVHFEWRFVEAPRLKRYYITVAKGRPVELKGPSLSLAKQEEILRQKAGWIRKKLQEVARAHAENDEIATGSRIRFQGRDYDAEVMTRPDIKLAQVEFTGERFRLFAPDSAERQALLQDGLLRFFRRQCRDLLMPRVAYWEERTGHKANVVSLYTFRRNWANCSADRHIKFHPRCVQLAPELLDYVIVHELAHLVHLNHSNAFWSLVADILPDWEARHRQLKMAC